MQVIRKVNNNVAICLDSSNREIIAFGNGIGFPQVPYELHDLSIIKHTYYDVDERYIGLLNELPEQVIEVASKIVEIARNTLQGNLNSNVVFTLADHLAFAIERVKQGIELKNPLTYDLQHLYPKEMKIARQALSCIKDSLGVTLADSEITSIALHVINAENGLGEISDTVKITNITNKIMQIIHDFYDIKIDENNLSFSRFIVHLHYLIMRSNTQIQIEQANQSLYEFTKVKYPKTYECLLHIKKYMEEHCQMVLNKDEELYLMIHLNRLSQINE